MFWILKLVSNNDLPKNEYKRSISPVVFSKHTDGNIDVTFTTKKDGKCKEEKIELKKTDDPNKFTADQGKVHVHINKMSEENYWMIICEGKFHGKPTRVAKLMGPNTDIKPEVMTEFQTLIEKERLGHGRMVIPRHEGKQKGILSVPCLGFSSPILNPFYFLSILIDSSSLKLFYTNFLADHIYCLNHCLTWELCGRKNFWQQILVFTCVFVSAEPCTPEHA
uniref:Lipocalin/cytosolic fatty-acid binding domain-containing protein n=1 Tax=Monodelphis domestica TaxID=13616 RepID=F7G3L0_MONDO